MTIRARVDIDGSNNVVTAEGDPLRGEAVFLNDPQGTTNAFTLGHLYDRSLWLAFRDDFNFNIVRLYCMRPPQNWGGGPGSNCFPPTYRCYDLDYKITGQKTALQVIDDAVDMAALLGMYIIIDYHPVGGYNTTDCEDWWDVIAPRYASDTHVIYEVANEPVQWNPAAYDANDVIFEENMYDYIRSRAANTHIILWSFAHMTGDAVGKVDESVDASGIDINYSNASVGWHPYGWSGSSRTALQASYPAINTEIGCGAAIDTFDAEALGVSWIGLGRATTHGLNDVCGFLPAAVTWGADPNARGSFTRKHHMVGYFNQGQVIT